MLRFLSALALLPACAAPQRIDSPAPFDPAPTDVVVVGGGLAGLVTAYELEKRGIAVHLLEAADLLGGRVQTAEYGPGLRGEYGMQELWQGNPLLDIARELGLSVDEGKPAYSSLYNDGKLEPFVQDTPAQFLAAIFTPAEHTAWAAWMKQARQLIAAAEREGLADPTVRGLQDVSPALQRV